jgi:hypothetical protein
MTDEKPKERLFKNRYDNDHEFRAKHLAYVSEKIQCDCGKTVMRSNFSIHRKSRVHQSNTAIIQNERMIHELTNMVNEMKQKNN